MRPGRRCFSRQGNVAQNDRNLVAINLARFCPTPGGCGCVNGQAINRVERAGGHFGRQVKPPAVGLPVVVDQTGREAVNSVLLDAARFKQAFGLHWPAGRVDRFGHATAVRDQVPEGLGRVRPGKDQAHADNCDRLRHGRACVSTLVVMQ